MPNRVIKESIRTSKKVNSLTDFQFRLWLHLITYVDDYGRGSADPELLKGFLFPRRKGITETQIRDALTNLANAGMITLYEVDEESFLYFPNWGDHQRIRTKVSKFPAPGTSAASCGELRQTAASCGQNTNPESRIQNPEYETNLSSPNGEGEKRARERFTPPTLEEVRTYARQRNSSVDADKFYEYFTAGEWKDSKGNPVRNWKQKLLTWEKFDTPKQVEDDPYAKYEKLYPNDPFCGR